MRSSKGPEMRLWYSVTAAGAHLQAFCGSPKCPQVGVLTIGHVFVLNGEYKGGFENVFQVNTLTSPTFVGDVFMRNARYQTIMIQR